MADKVKVGLIGCGGIAHLHVRQLLEIPEAEIVALNDTSKDSIERMQAAFPSLQGLPVYDDYQKMIDEVDMDVVEISTPHTLHFQQAMDAMDKGLHVLLEKPMVCCVDHAKKLMANAEEKNRIVVLSYQRHFQPQYQYIKKVISEGQIGNVTYVAALQCQNWKHAVAGTWRQIPELSGGGQLNDSGSHLVDMVLWTTGLAVDEVYASVDNCGTPVDINSALAIKFTNCAQGTISVVGDAPTWHEDFTIWGDNGALFYRNGNLLHIDGTGKPVELSDMPEASNPDVNLINAILGRDTVKSPMIGGLRVIELTEAAWKSGERNAPVKVSSL
ncbi:MAG: Gfo/Idh/MocA family protein [Armatimonadota bacterium]